ncbi:MAG: hypothetical protein HY423_04575 [Candidatus Lambdaproteobacteria bacterium]|nr:hypothetical protein [Candidatus Lambdaproteobacteria bacterium]
MFTAMKHSAGELSPFFVALRDECRITGHFCPSCKQTICPPFQTRCPECNFVEMERVSIGDRGVMAAAPVIVFFAPSRFKNEAPFANGYVFLRDERGRECDTALPVRVRTTTGMMRPGIVNKNTPVKVVFKNTREGSLQDIFVVAESELRAPDIQRTPLMESDLIAAKTVRAPLLVRPRFRADFARFVGLLSDLSGRVARSGRAQADLAGWRRSIRFQTGGGTVDVRIDDKVLSVDADMPARTGEPDVLLAIDDPKSVLAWITDGAALTNLLMDGSVRMDAGDLETITRLDRLPRSLRRDRI